MKQVDITICMAKDGTYNAYCNDCPALFGMGENAVLASKMVDNCCAVYDFNNKKIVLYYQAPEELNLSAFRKAVSDKIPRYMIPSAYYREETLRQNSSGKIDRSYYKKLING